MREKSGCCWNQNGLIPLPTPSLPAWSHCGTGTGTFKTENETPTPLCLSHSLYFMLPRFLLCPPTPSPSALNPRQALPTYYLLPTSTFPFNLGFYITNFIYCASQLVFPQLIYYINSSSIFTHHALRLTSIINFYLPPYKLATQAQLLYIYNIPQNSLTSTKSQFVIYLDNF